MIDVVGFHRAKEFAELSSGEFLPITKWIDRSGDDVGPFDYPVSAVAGPSVDGKWFKFDLSEFDPVTLQ